MAYRATQKEVSEVFQQFCEAIGKRVAQTWNEIGSWKLDCAKEYGGYIIQEIINEKGAVTMPLGDERLKFTELVERMRFFLRWLGQNGNKLLKEV